MAIVAAVMVIAVMMRSLRSERRKVTDMKKITAKVDGMMCLMCESHVNDMIRKAFKVKKVTSSHKKNETVIITGEDLSVDQIDTVLSEMGYHCIDVKVEPYKKSFFGL